MGTLMGCYPAIAQVKRQQLPRYSDPLAPRPPPLTKILGHCLLGDFRPAEVRVRLGSCTQACCMLYSPGPRCA